MCGSKAFPHFLLNAVIAVLVVASGIGAAYGAKTKPVEVVNTPLPVVVTNKPDEAVTISGRAVILAGETLTTLQLNPPICDDDFLVTAVHVGPEVLIGATSISVVNLPNWAVSVPVYQQFQGGEVKVALNLLGDGPEHLSVTLPAGQKIFGPNSLIVSILVVGGAPATHRFEFNVHVTGRCGSGFVSSP